MKRGKRELPSKRNYKGKTALVALVLLFCCTVGGTLAWLVATTDAVENTFTPAEVTCYVQEEFNGQEKTNVKIENTSNIDTYIRAAIVVNWVKAGEVYATAPGSDDYTMSMGSTKWVKGADGYYYYNERVPVDGSTENLIDSCVAKEGRGPEGYELQVTILADAIQADGMNGDKPVVVSVWDPVTAVANDEHGTLTVKS